MIWNFFLEFGNICCVDNRQLRYNGSAVYFNCALKRLPIFGVL